MNYSKFLSLLKDEYPKTAERASALAGGIESLLIPTLIAPEPIELPRRILDEAQRLVFLFQKRIRENPAIAAEVDSLPPKIQDSGHASVLMSYDFHVAPDGKLKLIEINTNASTSLLADLQSRAQSVSPAAAGLSAKVLLLQDFATELKLGLPLGLGRDLNGARVAIVDDVPETQKMYIEFLMYQELFEANGANVVICDRKNLEWRDGALWCKSSNREPIDLVYNRSTDFYFEEVTSEPLRNAMEAKPRTCVITPHPYEYKRLADKKRMVEWSQPGYWARNGLEKDEISTLESAILRTFNVADFDQEGLWNKRKSLVFKPKNSHGGKAVFRGASISRGPFQGILEAGGLAQEFVPAPTVLVAGEEFKYDLRFYAYKEHVRLSCARLYRGQMTNATTPGGGVTSIRWVQW